MSASDWTDKGTEWLATVVIVAGVVVVDPKIEEMALVTVDVEVGEPLVAIEADLLELLPQAAEITAAAISAAAFDRRVDF